MTSGLSHTFGATVGPVVEMTTGLTSSVFTSDLGAFAFLVAGFFLVVVFLVVFFFCAMSQHTSQAMSDRRGTTFPWRPVAFLTMDVWGSSTRAE